MNPDPRPAPHGSEDRADMLAEALNEAWEAGRKRAGRTPDARDLLARLDAAAPARDDTAGLRRWLDGEIDIAERKGLRIVREVHEMQAQGDMGAGVRSWQSLVRAENRAEVLREVRERLGATTEGVRDA